MMRGPRNHVPRRKQVKHKLPAVPLDNAFLTSPADVPGPRKVDLQDADVTPTTRSAFDMLCESILQYSPEEMRILEGHN